MTDTKLTEPRLYYRHEALTFPTDGSKGRNGAFTAISVEVMTLPNSDGTRDVILQAYSLRRGDAAPLRLVLSPADALVLAEMLQQAARSTLPVDLQVPTGIQARCLHCDAPITLAGGAWVDRTDGDGCGDAVHEPDWNTIATALEARHAPNL